MIPTVRAAQRSRGLCERLVHSGPREGLPCLSRASVKRRNDAPTDQGLRICGTHARAFTGGLVEIGSKGWREA